jgi:lipid-binding SYLF domain-containing protein
MYPTLHGVVLQKAISVSLPPQEQPTSVQIRFNVLKAGFVIGGSAGSGVLPRKPRWLDKDMPLQ